MVSGCRPPPKIALLAALLDVNIHMPRYGNIGLSCITARYLQWVHWQYPQTLHRGPPGINLQYTPPPPNLFLPRAPPGPAHSVAPHALRHPGYSSIPGPVGGALGSGACGPGRGRVRAGLWGGSLRDPARSQAWWPPPRSLGGI